MSRFFKIFIGFVVVVMALNMGLAQQRRMMQQDGNLPGVRNYGNNQQKGNNADKDSAADAGSGFQRRDVHEDSLTIQYKIFNKIGQYKLDTTVNDYNNYYSLPYHYITTGAMAQPAYNLLFNTPTQAGFNEGFNGFNVYNYSVQNTRLFKTTRAYTELAYMLGSGAEQAIEVLHTQNKKENTNFSGEYKFYNAPGQFRNQKANYNNTRLTYQYQSNNKRYNIAAVWFSNKNRANENGGLVRTSRLDSLYFNDPYDASTRMGSGYSRNPYSTVVNNGHEFSQSVFTVWHHYDVGQKDSLIINDTTVVKLFYPRLRFQHLATYENSSYSYFDNSADSLNYATYFNYQLNKKTDSLSFYDKWKSLINEFDLISYPDKKNTNQFLKLGALLENRWGSFSNAAAVNIYNIAFLGAYKNRTRNGIWDIDANAKLYWAGYNAGDYSAQIILSKKLSKTDNLLSLGFDNVNSAAPYYFNNTTGYAIKNRFNALKQNTIKLWGLYNNDKYKLKLYAAYYVASNYCYLDSFLKVQQEANLFNVIQVSADKMFAVKKHFNVYTQLTLQQATANAPVNLPFAVARVRAAFEGNFYKNLHLSTGVELRYITSFKTPAYSPFLAQYFYQNSYSNNADNLPNVNAFFNFRIKRFKGFVRAENLNSFLAPTPKQQYNFYTENYPQQSFWTRVGIYWYFVN